eukprot:scaffold3045_cov179-Ochromonas_danica.AAC.12
MRRMHPLPLPLRRLTSPSNRFSEDCVGRARRGSRGEGRGCAHGPPLPSDQQNKSASPCLSLSLQQVEEQEKRGRRTVALDGPGRVCPALAATAGRRSPRPAPLAAGNSEVTALSPPQYRPPCHGCHCAGLPPEPEPRHRCRRAAPGAARAGQQGQQRTCRRRICYNLSSHAS